jgi:starch phosphorylase
MLLAQEMVQGVDLWINTPRRPWEACGTSGMKVLVNGGLNLSELDGWWAEAYSPEVGWAIGDGKEHGDDPAWDAQEAEALYSLLEGEVVPEFYERDEANTPSRWLGHIRESMARLTPEFSGTRAIREYTEKHYLPAASNYQQRAAEDSKQGLAVLHWREELDRHWNTLAFGAVRVETHDGQHFFQVEVSLGTLNPDQICVELYANSNDGSKSSIESMKAPERGADSQGMLTYSAQVPATRASSDYTARIIPYHTNVSVPLEAGQILWQR